MNWTKFSTGKYPTEYTAFVTDYSNVWIAQMSPHYDWEFYAALAQDFAWAEIELPEVPKRELHKCVGKEFACGEDADELYLIELRKTIAEEKIKFCPFCGYSIKNKE